MSKPTRRVASRNRSWRAGIAAAVITGSLVAAPLLNAPTAQAVPKWNIDNCDVAIEAAIVYWLEGNEARAFQISRQITAQGCEALWQARNAGD